jgi:hypothetical protein
MTDRTGGCACGGIRFGITAPLMGVGVCRCTDCQKASGGGPNYVAPAPKTAFEEKPISLLSPGCRTALLFRNPAGRRSIRGGPAHLDDA